jgi:hypothetical protein
MGSSGNRDKSPGAPPDIAAIPNHILTGENRRLLIHLKKRRLRCAPYMDVGGFPALWA